MSKSRQTLGQTQALKQQQSLSPQQVLYVRLLGLNALEMEDDVSRALDENPALTVAESSDNISARDTDEEGHPFEESAESLQLGDFASADEVPFAPADIADAYPRGFASRRADDIHHRETADSSGASVMDHLAEQLAGIDLTPRQRLIATDIIGNIDDNGYLTITIPQIVDDLAMHDAIEVSSAEVREVMTVIRSLDPAGICAFDLRDCLLLQLRRRAEDGDQSPALDTATEMIADYFDLFSKRHFDRLTSALGIDRARLGEAMDIIRSLNPKPGALISGGHADDLSNRITPDFTVETDGSRIDLQMTDTIPELRIDSSFDIDDAARGIRRSARNDAAMTFIRSRRDEAASYISAIRQRRDTLYRVMRAIIALQPDFFTGDGDPASLRPMILKDVAAITGDDLSVISRATAGKYVATPSGTYPLRFFFNEAPKADIADSPTKIISILREIIDSEDHDSPLSDEALTAILAQKGYDLARRTVAKYREKAGIPVARLRRRL